VIVVILITPANLGFVNQGYVRRASNRWVIHRFWP